MLLKRHLNRNEPVVHVLSEHYQEEPSLIEESLAALDLAENDTTAIDMNATQCVACLPVDVSNTHQLHFIAWIDLVFCLCHHRVNN